MASSYILLCLKLNQCNFCRFQLEEDYCKHVFLFEYRQNHMFWYKVCNFPNRSIDHLLKDKVDLIIKAIRGDVLYNYDTTLMQPEVNLLHIVHVAGQNVRTLLFPFFSFFLQLLACFEFPIASLSFLLHLDRSLEHVSFSLLQLPAFASLGKLSTQPE